MITHPRAICRSRVNPLPVARGRGGSVTENFVRLAGTFKMPREPCKLCSPPRAAEPFTSPRAKSPDCPDRRPYEDDHPPESLRDCGAAGLASLPGRKPHRLSNRYGSHAICSSNRKIINTQPAPKGRPALGTAPEELRKRDEPVAKTGARDAARTPLRGRGNSKSRVRPFQTPSPADSASRKKSQRLRRSTRHPPGSSATRPPRPPASNFSTART